MRTTRHIPRASPADVRKLLKAGRLLKAKKRSPRKAAPPGVILCPMGCGVGLEQTGPESYNCPACGREFGDGSRQHPH